MNQPDWKIVFTKQAIKDREIAYQNGFQEKILSLFGILKKNPFETYPPYEKLIGDLSGAFSRRINHQHRLVYSVYPEQNIVKVVSAYESIINNNTSVIQLRQVPFY